MEAIIHILQPYPTITYEWKIFVIGQEVTYNFNMIFCTFCILRLYIIIKLLKTVNIYTNSRSKRIYKFFENYYLNGFLYKSVIRTYTFFAILIISCTIFYLFALFFKIYEHHSIQASFENLLDCLWYLLQTITTGN